MGQVTKDFFEAFRQEIICKASEAVSNDDQNTNSTIDDAEIEFAEGEIARLNAELKVQETKNRTLSQDNSNLLAQIEAYKKQIDKLSNEISFLEKSKETTRTDDTYTLDKIVEYANNHPEYARAIKAMLLHLRSYKTHDEDLHKIESITIQGDSTTPSKSAISDNNQGSPINNIIIMGTPDMSMRQQSDFSFSTTESSQKEVELIRKEICEYVIIISGLVKEEWREKWLPLWNKIIMAEGIENVILKKGKQQNTNFNRNLVANIIYYLGDCCNYKMIKFYKASNVCRLLEGNETHSVREQLRTKPEKEIVAVIDKIVENLSGEMSK